ncbi:MAG: RHS repeat protein, partial [Holophagales bacterium]|nr:RHS repeat protein [Holophagales bacterium]
MTRNDEKGGTSFGRILGTYTSRTVGEGGTASKEDFCFDATTGALLRHRVLASRGASPGRSSRDVLRVFDVAGDGNVLREDIYGGESQALSTGSNLCTLGLPSTPEYRTKHTYQHGSLKTSNAVDPTDGDAVVLKLADRTIHRGTGLPSRREDMAGYGYRLDFDDLGRLAAEEAYGSELASIGHEYPPPYFHSSLPRSGYLNTRCVTGLDSEGHCANDYRLLESNYQEVDGLGRLYRRARRVPIEGNVEASQGHTIERNGVGWQTEQSTWFTQGSGPGPAGETRWSGFDRFGRAGLVTRPDGTTTETTYLGVRVVSRKVQVATSHSGTSAVWSTELYDAHGRLVEVCAGATTAWNGSCSGQRTTYQYDEADRLVRVCQGA